MTIAAVQAATGTGTTTATATLGATPAQYNTLVGVVAAAHAYTLTTMPAGWTRVAGSTTRGWGLSVWVKECGASESSSITAGGANPTQLTVREYSGIALSSFDVSATGTTSSGTSCSTGTTAATSQADELAIAACLIEGNYSAPSWSNGFTLRHTFTRVNVADSVLSSIGAVTSTCSWTSARGASAIVATFRGGSPGPEPGRKSVGVPAAMRPGPGNPAGDPSPVARTSWANTAAVQLAHLGDSYYPWNPIASYNTQPGDFDNHQVREHGNAIFDPVTNLWILPYTTLDAALGQTTISASLSNNGDQWYWHPQNPLSGAGTSVTSRGEDPYLVKRLDGTLYRDATGRALMYSEEKPGGAESQRGVVLFRSAPWTLNDWIYYGRVLDYSNTAGTWDRSDRTSPVVIWDGSQFVMLFEGRNLVDIPINEGEIGVAHSSDGLSFTVGNGGAPIISRSSMGAWAAAGIVPDDVARFGSTWVLVGHGQSGAPVAQPFNNVGRWSTTDDPADWDSSSFTEMAGNPFDTNTSTVMFHGDQDGRCVAELDRQHLYATDLVS